MSLERVKTAFKGYREQVFPNRLDDLNRIWDTAGKGEREKRHLLKRGFVYQESLGAKTEDGYVWYRALTFRVGTIRKGKIAILLPWTQDWDKKEGVQLDRSVAVYVGGHVTKKQIDTIINALIKKYSG